MARLALPALLLAPLLAPAAAAEAFVRLEQEGGVWNGVSGATLAAGERAALVWVPPQARLHEVRADDGAGASWRAAGADALLVEAHVNATRVEVAFDIADAQPHLLRYRAPTAVEAVAFELRPDDARVPESPQATFASSAPGVWTATVGPLAAGEAVAVTLVAPDRVGELPLLLAVGGLALLGLLGTLAWHRLRPPLEGRAPERFLEHLAELQARLLPPFAVFAALNVLFFTLGLRAAELFGLPFVLPSVGIESSLSARAFAAMAERMVPAGVQLVVLRPADAVLAQVQMSLFLAFVTALPLLVYEVGAFVAPALLPRERRVALAVFPVVSGLFLAGALVGYLVMAPLMIRTLYGYAPALGAAPLLGVGEMVSFALLVVLAFAVAFELPVVMFALARLGVMRASTFVKYLRHALLVIVLVAGVITPDPSVVSQLMVALPVALLYLVGIGAAKVGERGRAAV